MSSARDQIVATTCQLLELQGFHATGLNQIIKESGSPKGSLYYYFPGGKEELAAEAIRYVGSIILERFRRELASIPNAAQAVQAFIRSVAYNVELSGFSAGGPITTVALETASTNEPLREECYRIYHAWQEAVESKLLEGGLSQERAERLAALVIASLEGGIILCRTRKSRLPLEQIAAEIGILITLAE